MVFPTEILRRLSEIALTEYSFNSFCKWPQMSPFYWPIMFFLDLKFVKLEKMNVNSNCPPNGVNAAPMDFDEFITSF